MLTSIITTPSTRTNVSEKRDPRSWWIDETFDKLERGRLQYSSARDDSARRQSHVRVVMSSSGGQGGRPFFRVFGEEPMAQSIPVHKGSIWHFSQIEVEHLIQATMAFTIALAFMTTGGVFGAINNIGAFIIGGAIYFIALSPAFVLHELAHKFSARKYGCWADSTSPSGLRLGSSSRSDWNSFHGPRSVMVVDNTTKSQFKIALAGPVTNVTLVAGGGSNGLGEISILGMILTPWMWGNAVLATFNMLPFGPLDGRKIKTWSDSIFWTWLIICVSLVWFNYEFLSGLLGN